MATGAPPPAPLEPKLLFANERTYLHWMHGCVTISSAGMVLAAGSGKANVGHTEPAAGMTGMVRLASALGHGLGTPNAQLRVLNPHVGSSLMDTASVMPVSTSGAH